MHPVDLTAKRASEDLPTSPAVEAGWGPIFALVIVVALLVIAVLASRVRSAAAGTTATDRGAARSQSMNHEVPPIDAPDGGPHAHPDSKPFQRALRRR